ncbi:MAG: YHS domain-containing (seleno)protein [Halopseudomonas aestusnigri]
MITRRLLLVVGALLGLRAIVPLSALASEPVIYSNSATGIAINGFDPVAYFTEGKPVEGMAEFSAQWKEATWHFSSKENRAVFLATPEKYAPQYGGYCAFAMSYDAFATTVPEAWSIEDGKLYLNFSKGVRGDWLEDKQGHIDRANDNWVEKF